MIKRQKIFVGISGGVDSSVAAYLLKQEGHEVHGVYVKPWSPEWLPCTWVEEKRDAMRICAALDIPFHFVDGEQAYKDGVAEYMIAEYRAGRTPNPDVLCNRVIKFGIMWDYAKAHGAEKIATGHYAQTDGTRLYKAIDPAKDQCYFLWMLTKEELKHVIFPIGALKKPDVRALAEKAGLFTAEKKDSQGICFLGPVDMRDFLKHYIDLQKGHVVDVEGNTIGEHDGVWFYTLGERHGFTVQTSDSERTPYYVVGKDIEHNTLIVSRIPKNIFLKSDRATVTIREANWLKQTEKEKAYQAQIRYHGSFIPVTVRDEKTLVISYGEVVPPGQSIVVYDGETVAGGGIIDAVS